MIDRGAWDIRVEELKYKYNEPGSLFNLQVRPKLTPNIETQIRKSGRPTFFDKEIAELKDEYPDLKPGSGYSEKFPAKEEKGFLYRGVSWEEYQFIMRHGFIRSNCSYNIGECQVGLTFFSANPDTAAHYAGTFQPYPWLPTFERPAYVLKIKSPTPERIDLKHSPVGEFGITGEIPVSDIVSVYEVRPYEISPGEIELRKEWYGDKKALVEGSRSSPHVSVAFREMTPALTKVLPKEIQILLPKVNAMDRKAIEELEGQRKTIEIMSKALSVLPKWPLPEIDGPDKEVFKAAKFDDIAPIAIYLYADVMYLPKAQDAYGRVRAAVPAGHPVKADNMIWTNEDWMHIVDWANLYNTKFQELLEEYGHKGQVDSYGAYGWEDKRGRHFGDASGFYPFYDQESLLRRYLEISDKPERSTQEMIKFEARSGTDTYEVTYPKDQLVAILHEGMMVPLEEMDPKTLDAILSPEAQDFITRLVREIETTTRIELTDSAEGSDSPVELMDIEEKTGNLAVKDEVFAKDSFLGKVKFDKIMGLGNTLLGQGVDPEVDPRDTSRRMTHPTPEEDRAWNFAMEFYWNKGMSDDDASEHAWKDLQLEFPRLKEFDAFFPEEEVHSKDQEPDRVWARTKLPDIQKLSRAIQKVKQPADVLRIPVDLKFTGHFQVFTNEGAFQFPDEETAELFATTYEKWFGRQVPVKMPETMVVFEQKGGKWSADVWKGGRVVDSYAGPDLPDVAKFIIVKYPGAYTEFKTVLPRTDGAGFAVLAKDTHIHETKTIGDKIVNKYNLGGTDEIWFSAWAPEVKDITLHTHSTTTSFEGKDYGRIGTRSFDEELKGLPGGSPERVRKVNELYEKQYQEAYALILEAFPEAASGRRTRGEIVIHAPVLQGKDTLHPPSERAKEVIKVLEEKNLDDAIATLEKDYSAKVVYWYEPSSYDTVWQHHSTVDQKGSPLNYYWYHLFQRSDDPNDLIFGVGRMGNTTSFRMTSDVQARDSTRIQVVSDYMELGFGENGFLRKDGKTEKIHRDKKGDMQMGWDEQLYPFKEGAYKLGMASMGIHEKNIDQKPTLKEYYQAIVGEGQAIAIYKKMSTEAVGEDERKDLEEILGDEHDHLSKLLKNILARGFETVPMKIPDVVGYCVSGLMRDYLVRANVPYAEAVKLSEEFDEQLLGSDWLRTYNGTTFDKSFIIARDQPMPTISPVMTRIKDYIDKLGKRYAFKPLYKLEWRDDINALELRTDGDLYDFIFNPGNSPVPDLAYHVQDDFFTMLRKNDWSPSLWGQGVIQIYPERVAARDFGGLTEYMDRDLKDSLERAYNAGDYGDWRKVQGMKKEFHRKFDELTEEQQEKWLETDLNQDAVNRAFSLLDPVPGSTIENDLWEEFSRTDTTDPVLHKLEDDMEAAYRAALEADWEKYEIHMAAIKGARDGYKGELYDAWLDLGDNADAMARVEHMLGPKMGAGAQGLYEGLEEEHEIRGKEKLKVGDKVHVQGEGIQEFVVKECVDERGDMPRILVEAIDTGLPIPPTKRVPREDIITSEITDVPGYFQFLRTYIHKANSLMLSTDISEAAKLIKELWDDFAELKLNDQEEFKVKYKDDWETLLKLEKALKDLEEQGAEGRTPRSLTKPILFKWNILGFDTYEYSEATIPYIRAAELFVVHLQNDRMPTDEDISEFIKSARKSGHEPKQFSIYIDKGTIGVMMNPKDVGDRDPKLLAAVRSGRMREKYGLETDSGSKYFALRQKGLSDEDAQYEVFETQNVHPKDIGWDEIKDMTLAEVQNWYRQGVIGQDLYEMYMEAWERSGYRSVSQHQPLKGGTYRFCCILGT